LSPITDLLTFFTDFSDLLTKSLLATTGLLCSVGWLLANETTTNKKLRPYRGPVTFRTFFCPLKKKLVLSLAE
jgi:hypothetical protein